MTQPTMSAIPGQFPGEEEYNANQQQQAANQGQPGGNAQASRYERFKAMTVEEVLKYLRFTNISNSLCVITLAVISITVSLSTLSASTLFAACYMIIFGFTLLCFECKIGRIEKTVRTYFGFLHTFLGRALFLFFVASCCVVISGDSITIPSYITGVLTAMNAIFNCMIIYLHPGFKQAGYGAFTDPSKMYSDGGKDMQAAATTYAKNNPELAAKAGGMAVDYAKENPQQAIKLAQQANAASAANDNPFASGTASNGSTGSNPFAGGV